MKIQRGPVLVAEGVPDRVAAVDRDRIGQVQRGGEMLDACRVLFEFEFRRMHADDDQARVLVLRGPGAQPRRRAHPVDARIGPEIHEHHLAAQRLHVERRRIDPAGCSVEWRHLAFENRGQGGRTAAAFARGAGQRDGQGGHGGGEQRAEHLHDIGQTQHGARVLSIGRTYRPLRVGTKIDVQTSPVAVILFATVRLRVTDVATDRL